MEIVGIYAQFYDDNESILFAFILRQGTFTKNIMSFQSKGQEMNQLKD